MSELVLPLGAAALILASVFVVVIAMVRRRRQKARAFLTQELGLHEVQPRPRGRIQWFHGSAGSRPFVAGLTALSVASGVDRGTGQEAGSRDSKWVLGIVVPVAAAPTLTSITHRGMYARDAPDPFDAMFRLPKGGERPPAAIREALVRFAQAHGRTYIWARRRIPMRVPDQIIGAAGHVLAWMIPVWPTRDQVATGLEDLAAVAEVVERA